MEKTFRIGEIAEILGVPASRLRYWESVGLLDCGRQAENQYRAYEAGDLMRISDLMFYRSLGLSIKSISEIDAMEVEGHEILCAAQESALEAQKLQQERQLQRLRRYTQALEVIQELRRIPFADAQIDTACIVPFELADAGVLRQYMDDPYLYSRVQDSSDLSRERRGLTVAPAAAAEYAEVLWRHGGGRYVAGLMREEVRPGYPNDLPVLLRAVQSRYQTGAVISRFLTRARENGTVFDFYKTYIEIL